MTFLCQHDGGWARLEFILCNVIVTVLLYIFKDSLLNQYIDANMVYINIIFHLIQLLSFIAYFMTSFKDPGHIKLPEITEEEEDENINIEQQDIDNNDVLIGPNAVKPSIPRNDKNINKEDIMNNFDGKYIEIISRDPNTDCYKFMIIDNIPLYNKNIIIDREMDNWWPSNYCDECNFIRPIRSKHCRSCGGCIARFDHHCPLVGNCVAINNYKYFVSFLFTECILLLWTLYIVINTLFYIKIKDINEYKTYYQHTIFGWIVRILFFVVIFILFFEIIGLFGFHLYLLCSGQTTMEYMRPDFIDKYLFEEMKRKKTFEKKYGAQQKNINVEEKKYDDAMDDDKDDNDGNDDNDDDNGVNYGYYRKETRYKYQYYGDVTSYPAYFDQGFIRNLFNVFNGYSHSEWLTPLKTKFRKIKSQYRDNYDDYDDYDDHY